MNIDTGRDEASSDSRIVGIADIIGPEAQKPGRTRQVARLLAAVDKMEIEDEDGMSLALEMSHEVPDAGVFIRLRLMPDIITTTTDGQTKTEYVLRVTTGDFITSAEEESELKRVALQLESVLGIRCIPMVSKICS